MIIYKKMGRVNTTVDKTMRKRRPLLASFSMIVLGMLSRAHVSTITQPRGLLRGAARHGMAWRGVSHRCDDCAARR